MLTICWAAKGGSGTSVTAAALALSVDGPSVLVDLAGELPWVLGIGEPDVPGILDWMSSDTPPDRLDALEIPLGDDRALVHRGALSGTPIARWQLAAAHWSADPRRVIVDAGTNPPSAACAVPDARRLLVTRPCYLAVRAAVASATAVDGIIVIDEPGRSLRPADIELAIGAPVVAELIVDPAVARAVDAGLLVNRIPRSMKKQLGRIDR